MSGCILCIMLLLQISSYFFYHNTAETIRTVWKVTCALRHVWCTCTWSIYIKNILACVQKFNQDKSRNHFLPSLTKSFSHAEYTKIIEHVQLHDVLVLLVYRPILDGCMNWMPCSVFIAFWSSFIKRALNSYFQKWKSRQGIM